MPHPPKARLRPLTDDERTTLERLTRARHEGVDRVARATILLAVAAGAPFTEAARQAGRRSGRAVANLVVRFNARGLAALDAPQGGGPPLVYGPRAYERLLREVRRPPDREGDGTATWSLTTLQRALRTAPDGLPQVSTWTILRALWRAGYTWQERRTWGETGTVVRKRKAGTVRVTDPETAPKRGLSSRRIGSASRSASRCGRRMRRAPTRLSRSLVRRGNQQASRRASPTSTSGAAPPSC
jgi:hypothetical protein